MRYLLLIAQDESQAAGSHREAGEAVSADYAEFATEMGARGVLQGGERLQFSTDATTVRVRNGEILTTDGPFAKTKERGPATSSWTARIWTKPLPWPRRFRVPSTAP